MNWSEQQGPIETDVPLRPAAGGRPREYPWRSLAVGQSFLVRCEKWERALLRSTLSSCKKHAEMKTGFKFAMRVEDKPIGGLRIWRVA